LPAEEPGLVRKLKVWSKSSIGSVAMGHELSTTTVQLAQACSVVANGGLLVRPKITMKGKPGRDRIEIRDEEKPRQILKPETAITMRQMMEGVVLHGTGKAARLNGYSSGGKTGSAQIFDFATKSYTHHYNASFMGFAPVTNPAIVIVVTLNGSAKYGGLVAAPVFKEIATAALRILDVPRDLPENVNPRVQEEPDTVNDLSIAELSPQPEFEPEQLASPAGLPVLAQAIGPKVPNFQGMTMRAVLQTTSSQGLPVEISGSGLARTQIPAPGAVLPPGERIRIQFVR
jgi:membrane peptidoglycan carboxypeptidase